MQVSPPEHIRIELEGDDWIVVRKRLNAGQYRNMLKRMVISNGSGAHVDPIQVGLTKMIAYLLDWSAKDVDGTPLMISDRLDDEVAMKKQIDKLDYIDYQIVQSAVEAHEQKTDAEREALKNFRGGGSKSSAISPSREHLAGDSSGFENSTETSTGSSSKSSRKSNATRTN